MSTTKKAAETAENTEVSAAETTADTATTVTIEKSQLDKLLGMYDELQELKKSMPTDSKAEKIKQDKELVKLIEKANKESEELVEYIAPTGSIKSNKNIEVNINGVQYTVPRGVKTNIPRKVAEIIDNSIKQAEFAQGVQDKAEGDNEIVGTYGNYQLDTDRGFELLVPAPYDRIYEAYCAAQIDRDYEEAERYSVDMSVYNQLRQDFGVWWFRTHPQKKRYNFHIG